MQDVPPPVTLSNRMAQFLTLQLHQPSLVLEEKPRGIHLWLL